jgi:hypothetical protein
MTMMIEHKWERERARLEALNAVKALIVLLLVVGMALTASVIVLGVG